MKSVLTVTGVIILVSALFCSVVQHKDHHCVSASQESGYANCLILQTLIVGRSNLTMGDSVNV